MLGVGYCGKCCGTKLWFITNTSFSGNGGGTFGCCLRIRGGLEERNEFERATLDVFGSPAGSLFRMLAGLLLIFRLFSPRTIV